MGTVDDRIEGKVYVVWEEEEKPDLEVRRACNRCYGNAVNVRELERIEIVSSYGTAHAAARGDGIYGGEGTTLCGIDATGETWWHHA